MGLQLTEVNIKDTLLVYSTINYKRVIIIAAFAKAREPGVPTEEFRAAIVPAE